MASLVLIGVFSIGRNITKRLAFCLLFLAAFSASAYAANANVQCVKGDWASGGTYGTAITATTGHLLAVAVHFYGNTAGDDFTGISDGTNTYTQIDTTNGLVGGVNLHLATYYAKNITGGSLTLTTTLNTSTPIAARTTICEVSGADTSTPLDVHKITAPSQVNPGSGTDAISSGAATTTVNGDYVFAATLGGANDTFTHGTGYTIALAVTLLTADEWQIQSSAGSIAGTFTAVGGTSTYFTGMAAFKAAGATGGTKHTLTITRVGH